MKLSQRSEELEAESGGSKCLNLILVRTKVEQGGDGVGKRMFMAVAWALLTKEPNYPSFQVNYTSVKVEISKGSIDLENKRVQIAPGLPSERRHSFRAISVTQQFGFC